MAISLCPLSRQGGAVAGVVLVKLLYMAAVFYAYSVSQALPVAVFLFTIKARWVGLVVMVMEKLPSDLDKEVLIQNPSPLPLHPQLCSGVCAATETLHVWEEAHQNHGNDLSCRLTDSKATCNTWEYRRVLPGPLHGSILHSPPPPLSPPPPPLPSPPPCSGYESCVTQFYSC